MPTRQRIEFPGSEGQTLAAALEMPDVPPHAYALFAHCFTCGKDIAAASRIARTLASYGIAVLRFDFTGLGGSQGDFGNTDFSSNVKDLLAAAHYLRREHRAPQLLVGHSLGGTAVLEAAAQIAEVRAVATLGAPASPEHVLKQFGDQIETIQSQGDAWVSLGGRDFKIRREFLDDARSQELSRTIARLKRALLIMHAPLDEVVSIDQASALFAAAKHPKSFISLDGADHLLSRLEDAQYVAQTIAAWSQRYIKPVSANQSDALVPRGQVHVGEGNLRFLREVRSDDHAWVADEPKKAGGDNLGPDPYEHLLAALGTCTSMTIRMYANRKKWPLDDVQIELKHSREHNDDCADCDASSSRIDVLARSITLKGALDEAQRRRLLEIADRCPVHRTLAGPLVIQTSQGTHSDTA